MISGGTPKWIKDLLVEVKEDVRKKAIEKDRERDRKIAEEEKKRERRDKKERKEDTALKKSKNDFLEKSFSHSN